MSKSKESCGMDSPDMSPPTVALPSGLDMNAPFVGISPNDSADDSKMEYFMNAVISRLDTIASKLEGQGFPRLAAEVDTVANTFEVMAGKRKLKK